MSVPSNFEYCCVPVVSKNIGYFIRLFYQMAE